MEQVISYHTQMVALEKQGVPIDWRQVAVAMANTLAAEINKPALESAE